MKRKCDHCDREATVHEMVIRNGKQVEKHLCESCARESGIKVPTPPSLNDVIKQFVVAQAAAPTPTPPMPIGQTPVVPAKPAGCPGCGLTFAEFRQSGLLGCADCYKAFEASLGPLLERAHEGGTHHAGKTPSRAGHCEERHERIAALRKQLVDAVAAEQYERAARLRDQLMHIDEPSSGSAEPLGGEPPAAGGSAGGPRR